MRSWDVCRLRRDFVGREQAWMCAGPVAPGAAETLAEFEDNEQSLPKVCCERMEMANDRAGDFGISWMDVGVMDFVPTRPWSSACTRRHVLPVHLQ